MAKFEIYFLQIARFNFNYKNGKNIKNEIINCFKYDLNAPTHCENKNTP